jgi:zinc transport system substrate-binding protein
MQLIRFWNIALKFLVVSGLWCSTGVFASESPKVAVTIAPFHALVSAIMEGVGKPTLLVRPGASPHHYTLRPSEVKALQQANILFWGGPELESFLIKPLRSQNPSLRIVQLDQTPQLLILPPRRSALFEAHTHEAHDHSHSEGGDSSAHIHITETQDMHFWLDPTNANVLVNYIAAELSVVDPSHRMYYQHNAKQFIQKIEALDQRLKIKLTPVRATPFIVFHDAYQYFERHYGLAAVGSINIHPEIPPSVERLLIIRATIEKNKAKCIFREPQFKSQIVNSLADETHTKVGELDPIGVPSQLGGEGYLQLLEKLADNFIECLTQR